MFLKTDNERQMNKLFFIPKVELIHLKCPNLKTSVFFELNFQF